VEKKKHIIQILGEGKHQKVGTKMEQLEIINSFLGGLNEKYTFND